MGRRRTSAQRQADRSRGARQVRLRCGSWIHVLLRHGLLGCLAHHHDSCKMRGPRAGVTSRGSDGMANARCPADPRIHARTVADSHTDVFAMWKQLARIAIRVRKCEMCERVPCYRSQVTQVRSPRSVCAPSSRQCAHPLHPVLRTAYCTSTPPRAAYKQPAGLEHTNLQCLW